MNTQRRLEVLERRKISYQPTCAPAKPDGWTDGEHEAVVIGLGIVESNVLSLNEMFIKKYQVYIDRIRSDYTEWGEIPSEPIIRAKPLTFSEVAGYDRDEYGL
jgi:hypothetical protein